MVNRRPIFFSVKERGWNFKVLFQGQDQNGSYVIWLNDIPISDLPASVGKKLPLYKASLFVNELQVTNHLEPCEWDENEMDRKLSEALRDDTEQPYEIELSSVSHSTDVTN